jgi:hypothetical protein
LVKLALLSLPSDGKSRAVWLAWWLCRVFQPHAFPPPPSTSGLADASRMHAPHGFNNVDWLVLPRHDTILEIQCILEAQLASLHHVYALSF